MELNFEKNIKESDNCIYEHWMKQEYDQNVLGIKKLPNGY